MLAGSVSAQSNASDAGQTTLRTTTTLVVVPALVQTPAKELVFSLTADDFTLTDNGVPQKVTLEADTTRPLSLVVLMQTGGAARGQFQNYANLEAMLAALLGDAPNKVSIVNFDSRPEAASPFTSDVAQWSDAINHPDPGDSGAAIFDSLSFTLDLLRQQPSSNRRVILLISQEHDSGSKTPLKDVIRTLGETNTAVYSITFSAEKTVFKQAFKDPPHLNPPILVNPVAGPIQGYFNLSEPLGLALGAMRKNLSAEVADLSGGESSSFDTKVQLDEDLGVLANHVRNSYVLSFYPTSNEPGLHTIKVGLVHHPELLVTARTNYWSADSAKTETTAR
jgi:VWFA-related protein